MNGTSWGGSLPPLPERLKAAVAYGQASVILCIAKHIGGAWPRLGGDTMQDLDRALAEIGAIKNQLAQGEKFHGLGPTAFAATAVLAVLAAIAQGLWLPIASDHVQTFLALWISVAAVSAGVIGFEMKDRTRRLHSHLADEMIAAAVAQFVPAAVAAALLTGVIVVFSPQNLWMAPGLWQIAFGIGVFA